MAASVQDSALEAPHIAGSQEEIAVDIDTAAHLLGSSLVAEADIPAHMVDTTAAPPSKANTTAVPLVAADADHS